MRSARQPARRPRKPFAALRGPARVPGLLLRPPAPPLRPAALPRRTGAAGAEAGSGAGAPGSGRRSAQRSSATLMWNHCSGPARCRATAGASAQLWGRGAPPSSQHVDMYMKSAEIYKAAFSHQHPRGTPCECPNEGVMRVCRAARGSYCSAWPWSPLGPAPTAVPCSPRGTHAAPGRMPWARSDAPAGWG